ncbi:FAD binding domain-containing protein [Actinoplanes sp. NBRC 103695]|uniref:FAD binding domain-containing protein n=1 Tax=Actinoplanes sp. NBRC 103695 TaxID=3032202 RepID=UPI0024A3C0D7|nr:FAD binding domain-containing protein [Actinoplanes sp. NBRC 103695]GLY98731.1 oxidoreductase [Actinoplanes sp. NBRC 103695]
MITAVRMPESAEAAAEAAARGGRVMAGGTVVMAEVNTGPVADTELISLRHAGLSGITVNEGVARVGATTTFAELRSGLGFLSEAIRTLASPTIRNLATVGGNLFVPQPYGDFAVCLLALDATVEIAEGQETPIAEWNRRPGEIVTAVRFAVPREGTWFYHKAMRRKLNSAAIVTVAAVVDRDTVRVALGGVAPGPVRSPAAERVLRGQELTRDVLDAAGEAALADIDPRDDAYASAWYRRRVLPVHVRRAFQNEEA